MADASDIHVSIDAAMHSQLRDYVMEIYKRHGLRIRTINCDWLDVSSIGDEQHVLGLVSVLSDSGR